MIKFDCYTNENKTEHSLKCPCISDCIYRILLVEGFGSGKNKCIT